MAACSVNGAEEDDACQPSCVCCRGGACICTLDTTWNDLIR